MQAKSMEEITRLLKHVKFKRKLLGGVDEDDVWRIIDKLQQEYATVIETQSVQNKTLLDERDRYISYLESQQSGAEGAPNGGFCK